MSAAELDGVRKIQCSKPVIGERQQLAQCSLAGLRLQLLQCARGSTTINGCWQGSEILMMAYQDVAIVAVGKCRESVIDASSRFKASSAGKIGIHIADLAELQISCAF
jgi:hypothetical protein